jgi:phosphate-selective porin OprO/OprP
MVSRWLVVVAFTGLLASSVAVAQSDSQASGASSEKAALQNRVDQLEQIVTRLQQRLDQLEQKPAANPAAVSATDANRAAAPADERIDAIDQKLRVIERNRELKEEEAAVKEKERVVVSAGREGFSISSADKSYRLKFSGLIQADYRTFFDDRTHLVTDTFLIRRLRPIFEGTVGKYIDFRLQPDFGGGTAALFDAYADLKFRPYAVLRGGKTKTPLGLELLQNDVDLTFIERALPSDLVPNRDEGFQLYGDIPGGLSYAVAVLNGAPDGTNIDGDSNDGKDVAGRLFLTPFTKSGPAALKGLGFGVGVTSGRQNGATLPTLKSTGGQTSFFAYGSGSGANAVTPIAAGNRLRYSPQLYYYNGPFGLIAEYVESGQQVSATVSGAKVSRDITNHSWQVAGSWVLTGERKSFKGVAPKKSLDGGKNSGFGAWEIAGRYSELNVDPTAFHVKFADITKSAEAARAWALGVNWYLNRNTKLSFDYEQTNFQGGATVGNRPTEKALLNRVQVSF